MSLPIYVSRNGTLIQPAQASISVFNPALYGAYGVYESMQVVHGVAFEQGAHLRRLARSAAFLELPLPAELTTFERWIAEVLAANAVPDCTLRVFVVGAEDGEETTAFMWPQPTIVYPAALFTHGAGAVTFEGRRFLPEAKSLNTLVSYLSRRQARAAGAHEALLHHGGYLTEGSNSNLFAVMDDVVFTPPAEEVLSGVTRDIVITVAAQNGLELREAPLALADVSRWTECFITSSSRHIMPVSVIDDRPVGDGLVGPLTSRLMALFEAYFSQSVELDERFA